MLISERALEEFSTIDFRHHIFFLFWKQVCPGQPPISFNGSSAVCGVRCSCRACVSMTERHAPHAKLNRGSRATAPPSARRDSSAAVSTAPPTHPRDHLLVFCYFLFFHFYFLPTTGASAIIFFPFSIVLFFMFYYVLNFS